MIKSFLFFKLSIVFAFVFLVLQSGVQIFRRCYIDLNSKIECYIYSVDTHFIMFHKHNHKCLSYASCKVILQMFILNFKRKKVMYLCTNFQYKIDCAVYAYYFNLYFIYICFVPQTYWYYHMSYFSHFSLRVFFPGVFSENFCYRGNLDSLSCRSLQTLISTYNVVMN